MILLCVPRRVGRADAVTTSLMLLCVYLGGLAGPIMAILMELLCFFSGFGLVRYCDFVYNTTVCTSAGGKGRRCDDFADASLCVPRRVGGADFMTILMKLLCFLFGLG